MKLGFKWLGIGFLVYLVVGLLADIMLGVSSFSGLIGFISGVVVGSYGYRSEKRHSTGLPNRIETYSSPTFQPPGLPENTLTHEELQGHEVGSDILPASTASPRSTSTSSRTIAIVLGALVTGAIGLVLLNSMDSNDEMNWTEWHGGVGQYTILIPEGWYGTSFAGSDVYTSYDCRPPDDCDIPSGGLLLMINPSSAPLNSTNSSIGSRSYPAHESLAQGDFSVFYRVGQQTWHAYGASHSGLKENSRDHRLIRSIIDSISH